MKRESIKHLLGKKQVVRAGSILLSAIVLGTGAWAVDQNMGGGVPELTTFVDMDDQISIGEEEVPLASAPKVTVKTKKTTKVVKLKKKAAKTKVTKKTTKKTNTKVKKSSSKKTTTKTETTTYVTEKYKKGSKKKTVLTTKKIKTTVTTLDLTAAGKSGTSAGQQSGKNTTASASQQTMTNTAVSNSQQSASSSQQTVTNTTTSASQQTASNTTASSSQQTASSSTSSSQQTASNTTASSSQQTAVTGEIELSAAAPLLDARVKNAYKALNFIVTIDSSVSYSGYFSARNQSITLRKNDDTIYHEMGHFLAFVAGNVDTKAEFTAVYQEEKDLFVGIRKAYATQNSSEYFAESFREYTLDPITLKNSRPKTYQSIENALNKVTEEQTAMILRYYSAIWK